MVARRVGAGAVALLDVLRLIVPVTAVGTVDAPVAAHSERGTCGSRQRPDRGCNRPQGRRSAEMGVFAGQGSQALAVATAWAKQHAWGWPRGSRSGRANSTTQRLEWQTQKGRLLGRTPPRGRVATRPCDSPTHEAAAPKQTDYWGRPAHHPPPTPGAHGDRYSPPLDV